MAVISIQDEIRSASRLVMERWQNGSENICDVIEAAYPKMGHVFHQRVIDVCFEDFCETITSEKGI